MMFNILTETLAQDICFWLEVFFPVVFSLSRKICWSHEDIVWWLLFDDSSFIKGYTMYDEKNLQGK